MEKAARSTSLGNSWHKDLNWLAALTELVYKLELLPLALHNTDKATTCALPVGDVPPREACFGLSVRCKA